MNSRSGISRRNLFKVGAAATAGALLLRPQKAEAEEIGPILGTVRQGACPFWMGDSPQAVSILPYGVYSGGTMAMAQVPNGLRGPMTRLKLLSLGAGSGVRAQYAPVGGLNLANPETIEFWAYMERPTNWANGDPSSGAMGYLTFSNLSYTRAFSAFFTLRPGWNHVRLGRSQFFAAAGSPSWNDTFDLMQISMNPCSAGSTCTYFGEFRKNGKDRPLLCLMFDDGEDSVRQNALPLLQSARIPATIAVISGQVGRQYSSRQFSTLNQLNSWPAGTAFVNHTVNHTRGVMDSDTTPLGTILGEINGCKQAIAGLPGFDPTMFIAPYGEWSPKYAQALTDCGVKYSRSGISGAGPGFMRYTGCRLDNSLNIPAWFITKDTTPAQILSYVDTGIASGQSISLVFHDIRPNPSAAIDYSLSSFQTVINGLVSRSNLVDFVTMPKLCERLKLNGLV
ncbi:MAG: polysaccharide deacetylase family protein [Fimbriimonadaceae bacterium]